MIVCVCHAISDREVEAAIDAGARSPAEVGAVCRAGTDCGSCQISIARKIGLVACAARRTDLSTRSSEPVSAISP